MNNFLFLILVVPHVIGSALLPHHTTHLTILFENERSTFLSSKYSSTNLYKEEHPWTTPSGEPCTREEIFLPQNDGLGWYWLTGTKEIN